MKLLFIGRGRTGLCAICALLLFRLASPEFAFARPDRSGGTLDDTFAQIDLTPDSISQLICQPFDIQIVGTFTDARVFSLRFFFDPGILQFLGVTNGPDPNMHLLPELVAGNLITVDGFFDPNYTGSEVLFTFTFASFIVPDTSCQVGFVGGNGYSGTADFPQNIIFSGDTTDIYLEGDTPLAPDSVIIRWLSPPANNDSIEVMWTPAYYDTGGDSLINPFYVVYREDVLNNPNVYDSVGSTSDTFFYDHFINLYFNPGDTGVVNVGVFEIRTRKSQP